MSGKTIFIIDKNVGVFTTWFNFQKNKMKISSYHNYEINSKLLSSWYRSFSWWYIIIAIIYLVVCSMLFFNVPMVVRWLSVLLCRLFALIKSKKIFILRSIFSTACLINSSIIFYNWFGLYLIGKKYICFFNII